MADSKTKPAKKRCQINWKAVYPLYRTGTLSNLQIVKQYASDHINSQTHKPTVSEAAIRKQAIKCGWQKDLAGAVQEKIKQKLVRAEVRDSHQLSDEEIVDEAAEAGTQVVVRHREEIGGLKDIEEHLLNELACGSGKVHVSNYKGEITITKLNLTITEKSATYKNLVSSMKDRVALERQALNIVDGEDAEKNRPKVIQVVLEDF